MEYIEVTQEPIDNSTSNMTHITDAGDDIFALAQMNTNESQFEDNTVISNVQRHQYHSNNHHQQQQQEQKALSSYDDNKNNKSEPMNNGQQQLRQEPLLLNVTTSEECLPNGLTEQQFNNVKAPSKLQLHGNRFKNVSAKKRKHEPERMRKGLGHLALKICEKVRVKGTTTYNEIAKELIVEELQNSPDCPDSRDSTQKNSICRRVYDVLNILIALKIIRKDTNKHIRWIGLHDDTLEECRLLEAENEARNERIKEKHEQLRELLLQTISFKGLINRNKEAELQGIIPAPNASIQLPFIVVDTHKSTEINCNIANDKAEYIFKFDNEFEMHDDAVVLKHMGLLYDLDKGQCSYDNIERVKYLVPPNFQKYIEVYGNAKKNSDSDRDRDAFV